MENKANKSGIFSKFGQAWPGTRRGLCLLRYNPQKVGPMTLPANKEIVLDGVQGKAMEIIAEIDPKESSMIDWTSFGPPMRRR